ncbi:hypothetical protein OG921_15880 [Aldersonia sp. NBC_00410]|uniref:hypothetical protein n=1 Tax=Aldersonia sp. NBC_00410 TaxID=2975954 RepID=UPI0022579406|nr:hypothetical protein [Aldersonia sp. NBC_00410]MCX5044648.1 hypothetical protein [Aldersonia sp. NBC_00410]
MKRTIAAAVLAAASTLVLAPAASAQSWGSSGSSEGPAPTPSYDVVRYGVCSDASYGYFDYRAADGDMTGEYYTTLPTRQSNGTYCGYLDVTMYDPDVTDALLVSFDAPSWSDYTSVSIYLNGVLQCRDTNDYGYAYCANY